MAMAPLTDASLDEFEAVRAEWLAAYVGAFASLPGNPKRARIERFGPVLALATAGIPLAGLLNSAFGLTAQCISELAQVLAFYREVGISPRFSIPARSCGADLSSALAAEGFAISQLEAVLVGDLSYEAEVGTAASSSSLDVREVMDESELCVFRDVYLEGFGWGAPWGRAMWDGITLDLAGWRFFLCHCDEQPAAAGILYQSGPIAYMAAATTLKDFRGRGCHGALLAARKRAALTAGCTQMTGATGFANRASLRNQQRAGLTLADAVAIWMRAAPG